METKVYGCIDGLTTTPAVIDWAAWSARRLGVPLELLHVLEPPRGPAATDFSGMLGFGAQESLLAQLSDLDAERAKLAHEAGRQMLAHAKSRALTAGVAQVDQCMRHGELVDTVLELEAGARLIVLGEHYRAAGPGKLHLDHRVERVIRAVQRPVLVATREAFTQPERVVIAYDGSATADAMVRSVARSPLLAGLPAVLTMCGVDSPLARQHLKGARDVLAGAGFAVDVVNLPGEPQETLASWLDTQGAALLAMGAYGHSRIRHWVLGSTTTTLLRLSPCPVLVLR